MSTFAQKKRRSTLLLRLLAFNISGRSEQLDMKKCAVVLYSMPVLSEVETSLGSNKDKSAVVSSILTSLGILKYRTDRLNARTLQDMSSAGRCRAVSNLGYHQLFAANVQKIKSKILANLHEMDLAKVND
jgi:hypothetical protein